MRSLARAAVTLLAAMVMLFAMIALVPGNPASILLGPRATEETVAAYTRLMHLDDPWPLRLAVFIGHALMLDLGNDPIDGRPVAAIVAEVVPPTLALAGSGLLIALVAGMAAGIVGATRPDGIADRLIGLLGLAALALPSFVVCIVLLLAWIALTGRAPMVGAAGAAGLLVPACALALGWFGTIARLLRSSLGESLAEPFIRTLRANGIGEWRILLLHALPLAMPPVLALLGVSFGQLIGGAVFAEIIFVREGLGGLIVRAIAERDFPLVEGAVLVAVLLFIVVNLAVDALIRRLDRRGA